MHGTHFFIFSLKRSLNIDQGVYINININYFKWRFYIYMHVYICTLYFIIFSILYKKSYEYCPWSIFIVDNIPRSYGMFILIEKWQSIACSAIACNWTQFSFKMKRVHFYSFEVKFKTELKPMMMMMVRSWRSGSSMLCIFQPQIRDSIFLCILKVRMCHYL